MIKKIAKWSGISLLILIVLLILVPILFKSQIKDLVLKEVNKTLLAEVELDDFDLTFLRTFPNMTVELTGVRVKGKNEFEGVSLADIKTIKAHVGFWSVVAGDQVEIDEVHVIEPTIDVRVLSTGLANYDIVKPDSLMTEEEISEPSSFKLSLKEYSIQNGSIRYDDRAGDMFAEIVQLNHTGSGDLTADVIDFKTETQMDKLTYAMDGMNYLTEVKTDAVVNLLMEFTDNSSKFTLKENEIQLNAVALSFDGFYEMLSDHDNMDIKLDASKSSFKEFLSLIPAFYYTGYESMITSGSMALDGFVRGRMDEKNLPGWDVNLDVSNASIKYPDLPGKISNIQVKAGSKFKGGDNMDLMTVDVPKFHANLSKNSMDASLSLRTLMSDPYIQSKIKANVDLSTLKDFMPMAEEESYQGILDADIAVKGRMSALENENYEAFTSEGTLILSDFIYRSADLPDELDIEKVKFTFSPQNLSLNELNATMGKSDFAMHGKVDNYFGYLLRDEVLKGDFAFNSNYLDLEKLMPASETTESGSGEASDTPTANSEEVEPVLIPANIDFTLSTRIKETRYSGVDFKNVTGNVHLKDEVASLDNLNFDAMGGQIGLKGKYDTRNHEKPKMDFGYSLKEIDIAMLAENFLTVGKLAPIAKHAKGRISSEFDMTTDLTASFEPILSSLSSIGDIRSSSISIEGFKNLEKLEQVTKLNNISKQTIHNFKTKFTVEDGKVSVTPFNIKLGKINTDVSGYTTLDQQMDYSLKMNVPKDQIPASMLKEVEKAISQINALAPKINVGSLPETIPVNVKMIGDVKNPKITTDFKEALLAATGNLKDKVIENIKETVKDSVQNVIDTGVDKAKEEIEKQKQQILANAQKEADKIVAEAKKAGDAVRAEADKQAEALIKEAGSNPIKKKLAEESAKKIRSEADKRAKQLEAEGQKQADAVMAKARTEANKLGN